MASVTRVLSQTGFTSGSASNTFSVIEGRVYLVRVWSSNGSSTNIVAPSGFTISGGETGTSIVNHQSDTGGSTRAAHWLGWFKANATSASYTVTITIANTDDRNLQIDQCSNDVINAAPVIQSATSAAGGTFGQTVTATLAAITANNMTYGAGVHTDAAVDFVQGSGWTLTTPETDGASWMSETQYKAAGDTAVTMTITGGANKSLGMIGIELDVTAAPAALTGTATSSITEDDIVAGGKTIILTLTGDTWVASGATFNAQRQNIINGLDSAQAEAAGWDAVVKATQGVAGVVRTSDTVVTITLDAFASYNITAQETITATIPSSAITGGGGMVASPTFTVDIASSVAAASVITKKSAIRRRNRFL